MKKKKKKDIVTVSFDPTRPTPLTRRQKAELKALAAMPDEEIDFSDIPETTEEFWKKAARHRFAKKPLARPRPRATRTGRSRSGL